MQTTSVSGTASTNKMSIVRPAQGDLDLVQRHRYGDEAAFEEVYRRYDRMIFNLAYRMAGGDAEKAADWTQEIFLRIYRYLDRFKGKSSLKTWIYRIALNHCRSKLSRRRWFTTPLAEEAGYEEGVELEDPGHGPEAAALNHDCGRMLNRALAQLAPAFREAVVLCDVQGLSYQEIAEVLDIRMGTVRSRIARGRERLRTILEPMLAQAGESAGTAADATAGAPS